VQELTLENFFTDALCEIKPHTGGAEHSAFEHLTGGVSSLERAMPSLAAHMQDL